MWREYRGVWIVVSKRFAVAGFAATARTHGRDEQGNLGLRFIDMPGVEVKRCGLGQQMGERVSNLQGC
jgi:hypothetical protein